MKSSLKFTAIALLLGGVLHVQNLNAATYASALDEITQEFKSSSGTFSTPKTFAASVSKLYKDVSSVSVEKPIEVLKSQLTGVILESSLTQKFLEEAREIAKENVKGLFTYLLGVNAARIASEGQNIALRDTLGRMGSTLAEVQQSLEPLHAFAQPSEQSVVVPVATLPTYTVVKPELSTLPVAEQVYLLKIRSKLASQQEDLTASLVDLETLLQSRQTMALTSRSAENLERAAFLVDAIPQIRAIAMITGGYLKSVLEQINEINASVKARSTMFWRAYPEPLQVLQLKELEARKNLAYAEWDGLIGFMKKPQVLASSTGADNSLSSVITSVLVTKVQASLATLSETSASPKMVVKSDGLISIIGDTDYTTEVNLTSQFMIDLQQLTVDFLKQTYGAQTLLQSTFAPSALVGFSELVEAKASLLPPPAPPAEVVVLPATATNTVINSSDMDDSFHDDEDGLVDPAAVAVIKEEATV